MSAILLSMYGWSKMAEGVREHTKGGKVDPHQRTAAKVLGLSMDDFFKLDKKLQKLRRQEAKIANFGFCSGMGAETLLKYAEAQGVYLKLEQAKEIKAAFRETYPEMNLYLKGSVYDGLMWETDRKSGPQLKEQQHYRLSKFLKTTDGPDPEYDPDAREDVDHWSERQRFWEVLEWAAKHKGDQQTQDDVRLRRVTHRVRKLTYYRSCTLTGRIRNHCSYTEERNHRLQAVSADGAKMALFKLMRKGFHLLSFIHDEICVALPKGVAQRQVKDVERIMIEEMEKVLGQGVPVAVASELAPCWSKA
jgi:DNA polymerase I-like protein with 3'-5' exonuclease and polymerase domains